MKPNNNIQNTWHNAFPKFKKSFFIFLGTAFILGNFIDLLSLESSFSDTIYYVNGVYISFSIIIISLYLFKLINIRTGGYLVIYSILLSLLISLVYNIHQPEFEKLFLREIIIASILVIPAGFILNKNQVLFIGVIIFIFFLSVVFIEENTFIRQSSAILSIAFFSYIAWIYYMLYMLEKWYIQQQTLFTELEGRNESLTRKSNELDRINKTKDRLFSIIAHDLKNPFNAIYGFSDLLIQKKDTLNQEKKDKYINLINHSASESINLLDNLYNWATSQTNDIHFNPTAIQIKTILKNVKDYFKALSSEKEITIKIDIQEQHSISADSNMLTTVLRNLVSNALKYTPRKGTVIIATEEKTNETLFLVKDSGIGVDDSQIKSLFKPEHQLQTPGTENEKGSGLGLIICKDFVARHGGKIWVRSEKDIGTTFYFTIPK